MDIPVVPSEINLRLYAAAAELNTLQPWTWMNDTHLFGVQDPDSGEIGYCCITGALGEHYSLAVYLGSQGLQGFMDITSGAIPNRDAMFVQKCLMASFENREVLEKHDLGVIKNLGLKFRGRHQWPLFRYHEPGYKPWYLDGAQSVFLTTALQQALHVATRVREDESLLRAVPPEALLVRVRKNIGGSHAWSDRYLSVQLPEEQDVDVPVVDELRLHRIKSAISRRKGLWEGHCFYSPFLVNAGRKPYYPMMNVWADSVSGMVITFDLSHDACVGMGFQNTFLDAVEKMGRLPEWVRVTDRSARLVLLPASDFLDVEVDVVDALDAIESFRSHLDTSFTREKTNL